MFISNNSKMILSNKGKHIKRFNKLKEILKPHNFFRKYSITLNVENLNEIY